MFKKLLSRSRIEDRMETDSLDCSTLLPFHMTRGQKAGVRKEKSHPHLLVSVRMFVGL